MNLKLNNRRRWISALLILTMLLALFPPITSNAAGQRIQITSLYTQTDYNANPPKPLNDSEVPRYTTGPITLTATLENIQDSQIPDLYYVITNMNTGVETIEKNNKAAKSGQFDVTFSNVQLTEGLNKVVIKLGDQNVIASAPGWVYFTPTTSITNLKINDAPFIDNQIYPNKPTQGTALNISGDAPNATEVKAYLYGDPQAKNAYFSRGSFFFIGDDVNKQNVQANFKLTPGDNFLTILAQNSTKTFQEQRHLIYDNGQPFAFDGKITHKDAADENGNGNKTELISKDLMFQPIVTDSSVSLSSKLKVDLTPSGDLAYRYVDVLINGQKYGPYDLTTGIPAPTVTAIQPTGLKTGYSQMHFSLRGTGMTDPSSLSVAIERADGTLITTNTPTTVSATGDLAVVNVEDGVLDAINSPYKFKISYGGSIIGTYSVQVTDGTTALPLVIDGTSQDGTASPGIVLPSPLNEGYGASQTTINFNAVVDDSKVRLDVLDKYGGSVLATVASPAASNVAGDSATKFDFPTGLPQGTYKLKVSYNGDEMTERKFAIGAPAPKTPTFASFYPNSVIAGYSDTYLTVQGADIGLDETKFSANVSGGNLAAGTTVPLTVVYAENNTLTLKLPASSSLTAGNAYAVNIIDATNSSTLKTFAGGLTVTAPANYNNETLTNLSPQQVEESAVTTTPLTITGTNLLDKNKMTVDVFKESDNTFVASGSVSSVTGTAPSTASVVLPFISAGQYKVKISYNGNELAQYPFVVVRPILVSSTPTSKSVSATTPTTMTITGTGMGRDKSKLKLRFEPVNSTATPVDVDASSVDAGTKSVFNLPSLPEGSYTLRMYYNGTEANNTLNYTVLSPGSTIVENAQWSKPGQYRVYDFGVNLTIPSERNQILQFQFYNTSADIVPPTTYLFSYVNPNLPYVDRVEQQIGSSYVRLSDGMEINELPVTLRVAVNDKTTRVNLYTGNFDSNTKPYMTSTTKTTIDGTTYFTFTLDNLPSGDTKLTFIPSNGTSTTDLKQGENPAGQQVRSVKVTTTPYVIIQNVYNGMIIRNASEINPILGRVVNVPNAADRRNIVVSFNGTNVNMADTDFSSTGSNFSFGFGSGTRSNARLVEGKNSIVFSIYKNGVVVTKATFEVFLFSTDAPQFVTVKPLETSRDPKFVPGQLKDSYVTRENYVQLQGQFANASEIKLTVHTKDAEGKPVEKYDRRFNNFTQQDPLNNNPYYFARVNSPINQFLTNSILLSDTGSTIFEFTITNQSNVVVTKTIEIIREPLPYDIVYPQLTNGKAVVNSNYVDVEMIAENADQVLFKKDPATMREVTTPDGRKEERFYYEVKGLRPGNNKIQFTVIRGTQQLKGTMELYYANTPIIGAKYKAPLSTKMKLFTGLMELSFPKGTIFRRNDDTAVNPFLSANRQLLFGIADPFDGRVDKYLHPAARDGQFGNPNRLIDSNARFLLTEPTGRFRMASPMFWIDAGTLSQNETDGDKIINGGGRLPYDADEFYRRNVNDLVVPSQRGTLTLKYDPAIRYEGWKYLSVYHFEYYEDYKGDKQWRWRNIGGVVNQRNGTITVPIDNFGYYSVMYMNQSFNDVINHPWARNDLDILYSKGVMQNKSTTSFGTNDAITRGEFVTMLVKMFEIPLNFDGSQTFPDVFKYDPFSEGLYDYKYIETAARAGIVRGGDGGRFEPRVAISRQDAAVMIARAANLKLDTNEAKVLSSLQKLYTDGNGIEIYAQPSVLAVSKAKLIEGSENILLQGQKKPTYRFDPLDNFTRAEAARVAIRVLQQQKKIPK